MIETLEKVPWELVGTICGVAFSILGVIAKLLLENHKLKHENEGLREALAGIKPPSFSISMAAMLGERSREERRKARTQSWLALVVLLSLIGYLGWKLSEASSENNKLVDELRRMRQGSTSPVAGVPQ